MNQTIAQGPSSVLRDRALVVVVTASFLVCYADVFSSLVQQWSTNDVYAHGFLIPLISAYLLWERREVLARTPIVPAALSGSLLLAVALGALAIARVGSIVSLQYISLLIAVHAVVLLLLGRGMLRETIFPLLFLVFMLPIWEVVTDRLHTPFQLLSARIGASLLQTIGVPIHLEGVMLELPHLTLEVARACSGVNFVVAILALALPQAYLMLGSVTLQICVAIWAVIVALVSNGLRVAVIGAVAYNGQSGPDIHGPGHVLQGLSVAVAGFIVLFCTILVLAKRWPRGLAEKPQLDEQVSSQPPAQLNARIAIGTAALLLMTPALGAMSRTTRVAPETPVREFPSSIGAWFGTLASVPPPSFRSTGADDEISKSYVDRSGMSVRLYVGYFRDQTQSRELVTEQMLELQRTASRIRLNLSHGAVRDVNELLRTDALGTHYVLFWYALHGRSTPSGYVAKGWTIWDSLVHRRSNGALVMVIADVAPGADRRLVTSRAQGFAQLASPVVDNYLPH